MSEKDDYVNADEIVSLVKMFGEHTGQHIDDSDIREATTARSPNIIMT